ncbi:ankyrin repeat and MYND domain-containing protein 1 [Limanda limanda]|uniref:ankyrin repeat and MYND domain-containing protein 1 n=1 Tax=Limanda limanda TaxID=27771 RepID=UPI0029C66968|nr:ankyrin repeat and MYND domain-containing protein 1 [Limanda limanda]
MSSRSRKGDQDQERLVLWVQDQDQERLVLGVQDQDQERLVLGVQEGSDGSRYEGQFLDGLKHGRGKYTFVNGEYHEGFYYKDYRHGNGQYCWPMGQKFTGKFYLNRREGYGHQVFLNGATFQGLFHMDHRLGPGVVTYSDGCQNVGLWVGPLLLRFCSPLEEGFSLKNFPEYAALMDPAATPDSLTQTQADRDLLLVDEDCIYPPGIERFCTNGDLLPLPPRRRKMLDQQFFGKLWEPEMNPYLGYKRDPYANLSFHVRLQENIHKHRRLAEHVSWDVAAVLSMNRDGFGPKGILEVSSEQLIRHASRGELAAVAQILKRRTVYPDVADSQDNTALIAATINNRHDVICLLLNRGVHIDKLNCEGMSALAVCLVLFYPFHSLNTTMLESPQTQVLKKSSSCGSSSRISHVDFTRAPHSRPQTSNTTLSQHSDRTAEKPTDHISHPSELVPELERRVSRSETKLSSSCGSSSQISQVDFTRDPLHSRPQTSNTTLSQHSDRTSEEPTDHISHPSELVPELERRVSRSETKLSSSCGSSSQISQVDFTRDPLHSRPQTSNTTLSQHSHRTAEEPTAHISHPIELVPELERRFSRADSAGEVRDDTSCSVSSTTTLQDTEETEHKMAAMTIENNARLETLKILLERGADPNLSRVPMPVLFLAIMASDIDGVRRLLLGGARTDIPLLPQRKGLYPLHVAAALPGGAGLRITEMLFCAITDPDAQACDQDDIYEPDKETLSADEQPRRNGGGRTALHVACQRVSDDQDAGKVVALLLSHRASTHLLWSGHSPLSLAIASGNKQAVKELLRGGADPNLPLGREVGSALCAVANINYHWRDDRLQLLDMLVQAGADFLMPIMVGGVEGTAVDFAYNSFHQDGRIAHTPYLTLTHRERETFNKRHQLLSMMGNLLRQTAVQREKEALEREQQLRLNEPGASSSNKPRLRRKGRRRNVEKYRIPLFKFCYDCGRSASVTLTSCFSCHKVSFCSQDCKLKAWKARHRDECVKPKVSGSQRKVVVHKHLTEKVQVKRKHNYSHI